MKKKDMTYDEIYQETASKLLLDIEQQKASFELSMRGVLNTLYGRIRPQLYKNNIIEQDDDDYDLYITPENYFKEFEVSLKKTPVKKDGKYIDEQLFIQNSSTKEASDSLKQLVGAGWLDEEHDRDEVLKALTIIRSLGYELEDAKYQYTQLELAHWRQFIFYLYTHIEPNGVFKNGKSYMYLTTLDPHCCSDDDGFCSGLTIVLIERDWKNSSLSEEQKNRVSHLIHSECAINKNKIRELLHKKPFLVCKVGNYYPLSFEQLWDQMCIGMNLDKPVNPKQ